MKRILRELKPYYLQLILSLLLAAVSVACTLYIPIAIGRAVDCMVGVAQVDFDGLFVLLTKMGIAIVLTVASSYLMALINNHMAYGLTGDLRKRAFEKILHLPVKDIDASSHGDYVSRLINDADNFSDGLLLGFSQGFTSVLTIAGTIVLMLGIRWQIGLLVIALSPLSMLLAKFIAEKTRAYFTAQAHDRGEVTEHLSESVEQQKLLRQLNAVEKDQKDFAEKNDRLKNSALKATFYSSITNPGTRFVNSLIYGGVVLLGAYLVTRGEMTVGILTAFLGYAREYSKPFNEITGVITEMQNAFVCGGRLFELMDTADEVDDGKEEIENPGRIEFKDVSFSYDKNHPLMQHLSLSVSPGQKVAIVGPTGAGKTTLINLLMRFYDVDEGAILIDGTDIRAVQREKLHEQFGMVLQETWLKDGTILENIRMGKKDATREEVTEAAKLSHAHDFIKKMKKGYDTLLTGEGGNLSAGQRQLLCITRLLLSPPPMLILDEATSSIDTRTEVLIQKSFARLMKGRTTFIVAHRLSTILDADLILYMENGTVCEQGTHAALLSQNGKYAALYNSQFVG